MKILKRMKMKMMIQNKLQRKKAPKNWMVLKKLKEQKLKKPSEERRKRRKKRSLYKKKLTQLTKNTFVSMNNSQIKVQK